MTDFFTTVQTSPPSISIPLYLLMFVVLLGLIWLSVTYYRKQWLWCIYHFLQSFQLLSLYIWYGTKMIPISNSLPFYHCRLAMFALLLLPDKTKLKQYFALMGVSGAIFAIGYPIMDAYTFPHITAFSFLIGHYALLVGSIIYLMRYYKLNFLSWKAIILYTFVLNLFLVIINYLTGGNYGILRYTPFITNTPLLVRYLAVTFILTAMLLLIDWVFIRREYGKARAER
ncbi:TIGR02206 family membrane protein [Streptococcus mutans]|uniref:YwaF family protein n=1 Tax=Streptococcus mutans TaxID=1309 RepID=UPI0004655765|nr:TIGR02206 family membrane protein [Streptococcus mutans]